MTRIYLSPPDVGALEREQILDAFDSGWIAPLGPHVDGFESEIAEYVGVDHALATSSGTAALHLALMVVGVEPGDTVLCSTLTFVASANPIRYLGATPVFVDCEPSSWCIDPSRFAEAVALHHPKAAIVVDLYGHCPDYQAIIEIAEAHGVELIEDAAEALGGSWRGRSAGSFGRLGVFSFNGNKIITTSGGGMLVGNGVADHERARYLATQAREQVLHYEHQVVGYNYRMSNLLAALGRGQLSRLDIKVARRRAIFDRYAAHFSTVPGLSMHPEPPDCHSSRWLTCVLVDGDEFGASPSAIIEALDNQDIEARPVWKPMHVQPLYRDAPCMGGEVAVDLFTRGLCLPSGSSLADTDVDRIAAIIASVGHLGRSRSRSDREVNA